jgi:serine phosphatase RsbU (regulator of sigma subunit)
MCQVSDSTAQSAPVRGGPEPTCRGPLLVALRVSLAALALLALVPAIASFVELVRAPSLDLLSRAGVFSIDPEIAASLEDLLSRSFLLGADFVFRVVGMAVFTITALIIFIRKSDDWMIGLVSITLIATGTAWFAPLGALPSQSLMEELAEVVGAALPFSVELGGSVAGICLILFFYLFPDGRFVPSWTRYASVFIVAHGVLWIAFPGSAIDPTTWPLALEALIVVLVVGSGLAAQAYRYSSMSTPSDRQQTKLVVFAILAALGAVLLLSVLNPGLATGLGNLKLVTPRIEALYNLIVLGVLGLSLLLFPLSIGVSVLRYRLWDIDLFINRTLVYGALTGVLGAAYFGVVALVGAIASQSYVTIAAATLLVAVLFQPVRTRIQELIDRAFYRQRYDAAKTLEAFTARLRQEIDLQAIGAEMMAVVEETMYPQGVSLWIPKGEWGPKDAVGEIQPHTDLLQRLAFRVTAGQIVKQPDFEQVVLDPRGRALLLAATGPLDLRVGASIESSALRAFSSVGVTLAVPLVSHGEFVGMLNLGPRLSASDYSSEDSRLLARLADQAGAAIRVALLVRAHDADVRERQRIENEMQVARLIQRQFLPKELPHVQGWEVDAYYQAAREVGGDFYDFIEIGDGRLAIVAGDVTGKGVPAALVMATARSILRGEAPRVGKPGAILAAANSELLGDIPAQMFVTCLCIVLDPATGQMSVANAGHNRPYLCGRDGVRELRVSGMPLGLMNDMVYEEMAGVLDPGQSFILSSDGLIEAHNREREMFGFPRMESSLQQYRPASSIIEYLLGELEAFTGPGWEQEDDITLVVLHRVGAAEAVDPAFGSGDLLETKRGS